MLIFFSVDLQKEITLVQVQRIASYGSRYVMILEVMTPFLACIHRLMAGKAGWHGTFPITNNSMGDQNVESGVLSLGSR
jgi:hypothetical protein